MSGHSKWAQIKHKKGAADEKRGKLFSKLSLAISIAARDGADPAANPRLRTAIEKAKQNQVPNENIDRALARVRDAKEKLERMTVEAYGPEGTALYIIGVSDNANRFMEELRTLLKERGAKAGEPGSAAWAFEKKDDELYPKFTIAISDVARQKLSLLVNALEERDDVQGVWTNAA